MPDTDHDMTPAQEREARRKLRRVIGDGTPDEQVRRVLHKAFQQAGKREAKRAARVLVRGFAQIILDALKRR